MSTNMDFPTKVDVIILGTGLTETILSAALSRAGKTVLHLDRNKYYGREWASFCFSGIYEFVEGKSLDSIDNVEIVSFLPESLENGDHECCVTLERLKSQRLDNKFCIDLCPRMIFSQGPMVELLVQSNICRYLEFKKCTRLFSLQLNEDDGVSCLEVPCTREAVFADHTLSLIQKRKLMKFLDYCLDLKSTFQEEEERRQIGQLHESSIESILNLSFEDFLVNQKMKEDPSLYRLLHSVSVSDSSTTRDFLKIMSNFISSSGRYGSTPFLWTLYGSGELPQSFARLSAVFGGLFCLGQEVDDISLPDKTDEAIIVSVNSNKVECSHLIGSLGTLPKKFIRDEDSLEMTSTCHAICLTNKSIHQDGTSGTQHISFGRMHDESLGRMITVIELGDGSACVPPGFFLVYLSSTTHRKLTAKEQLDPVIEKMFRTDKKSGDKPLVHWKFFFNRQTPVEINSIDSRITFVRGPNNEQDYESSIQEAKQMFHRLYPDATFLPRAPDAEDIVMEGEDE